MKQVIAGIKRHFTVTEDGRELALNHDTGLLKILACLFMLSDHMGKMLFPDFCRIVPQSVGIRIGSMALMRVIGRLAMPIFAYCIAVGCKFTRNIWKYALRLLIMGILVHPLYQEAMGHVTLNSFDWTQNFWKLGEIYRHYYSSNLNILFTLFFGVIIIGCIRAKSYIPLTLACLAAYALGSRIDYGTKGVILIVLFYAFLDKPLVSFVSVLAFMLYWTTPTLFTRGRFSASTEFYAIASLIFIYLPVKKRCVKLPKWFFYGFYPAHLLVIYFLQVI